MNGNLNNYWRKYLKGTISKEEIKVLLNAFEQKDKQDLIDFWLKEKWDRTSSLNNKNLNDPVARLHQQRLWNKIKRHIAYKNPVSFSSIFKIATAITLLISSALIWKYNQPDYKTLIVNTGNPAQKFNLPDGSSVWLNSASTLKYQTNFNTNRNIELTGEAYFEVAKNKISPFKVQFTNTELKVTGTQFNISAYRDDSLAIVHIKEGSVVVHNAKDSTSLKANNYLTINKENKAFEKYDRAFDHANSWKEDVEVFKNTSLLQILKSIERRHNVFFKYDKVSVEELKSTAITININHKMKVKEILKGLTLITKYNYETLTENKISIKQKK